MRTFCTCNLVYMNFEIAITQWKQVQIWWFLVPLVGVKTLLNVSRHYEFYFSHIQWNVSMTSDLTWSKWLFCIFVKWSPNGNQVTSYFWELLVFIYLHRFLDPVLIAYSQNYALLYASSNYIWIQNVLYTIWQWLYQKYMHVELYKLVYARWATSWCTKVV